MKATDTPPMLSLRVTEIADIGDIYLVVEPGTSRVGGVPMLIVHSMAKTWSTALPEADPIGSLARMGPAKLRDALEFSAPSGYGRDAAHARAVLSDVCSVIPLAVQQHIYRNPS